MSINRFAEIVAYIAAECGTLARDQNEHYDYLVAKAEDVAAILAGRRAMLGTYAAKGTGGPLQLHGLPVVYHSSAEDKARAELGQRALVIP